jgi:cell division protein ZipA
MLLVVGILIIAGIYVWGRYGATLRDFFQRRGAFDELGLDQSLQDGVDQRSEEFGVGRDASVEETVRPVREESRSGGAAHETVGAARALGSQPPRETSVGAPFLIQVSVVARPGESFSGEDLRDALLDLGLVHGEMDIFHRYDRSFREPLFSVASLVRPGTFPIDDMESFSCPGVVLFFQPSKVADPLAVFDDLFETSRDLAEKLDGEEWDESRRTLTEQKIRELRERVEDVCR